jgi:hypothetical protein
MGVNQNYQIKRHNQKSSENEHLLTTGPVFNFHQYGFFLSCRVGSFSSEKKQQRVSGCYIVSTMKRMSKYRENTFLSCKYVTWCSTLDTTLRCKNQISDILLYNTAAVLQYAGHAEPWPAATCLGRAGARL